MPRVPCEACKSWMSDAAAVCPHCGARQARSDAPDSGSAGASTAAIDQRLAAAKKARESGAAPGLDATDARALLEIDRANNEHRKESVRTGLIESELFPKLSGRARR